MRKNLFLSTLLFSVSIFGCKGTVANYVFQNGELFTGLCSSEGLMEYGEIEYDGGDKFKGKFDSEGKREFGTYTFANGNYYFGRFYSQDQFKGGFAHDFKGVYYASNGFSAVGYFYLKGDEVGLNGYGVKFYAEGTKNTDGYPLIYDAGEFSDNLLNGTGMRKLVDFETDKEVLLIGTYDDDWLDTTAKYYFKPDVEEDTVYEYLNDNFLKEVSNNFPRTLNTYVDTLSIQDEVVTEISDTNSNTWTQIKSFIDNLVYDSYEVQDKSNQNFDPSLIKAVQVILNSLSYDIGEPDGVLGPLTKAAIKAFQIDIGKDADGIVDEILLVDLQTELRSVKEIEKSRSKKNTSDELVLTSTGSAFFINENYLVTNFHVIDGCRDVKIENISVEVKVKDPKNDIAILKSKEESNYFFELANNPKIGEDVFALGFPIADILGSINFTSGNVSSLSGFLQDITTFQFTAPIQGGNSGGPVINNDGEVVGVAVAKLDSKFYENTGEIPQNVNFAIKVNLIKDILDINDIEYVSKRSDSIYRSSMLTRSNNIAEEATKKTKKVLCYVFESDFE